MFASTRAEKHFAELSLDLDSFSSKERKEELAKVRKKFNVASEYCHSKVQIDYIHERLNVVDKLSVSAVSVTQKFVASDIQQSEAVEYGLFKVDKAFVKGALQPGNRLETVDNNCHVRLVSRSEGRDNIVEINLSGAGDNLAFAEVNQGDKELRLSLSPSRINLNNYDLYIKYDNGEVLRLGGGKGRYWGLPVRKPSQLEKALMDLGVACKS